MARRPETSRARHAASAQVGRRARVRGQTASDPALTLQRSSGNRAFSALLSNGLSAPADATERAAERLAERALADEIALPVPGMPNSACPRLPTAGAPLPPDSRALFESRYGVDLRAVRLHADAATGRMADRLGARAFTVGSDIGFAPGAYAPQTPSGDALLAHELAHVALGHRGIQRQVADDGVLRQAVLAVVDEIIPVGRGYWLDASIVVGIGLPFVGADVWYYVHRIDAGHLDLRKYSRARGGAAIGVGKSKRTERGKHVKGGVDYGWFAEAGGEIEIAEEYVIPITSDGGRALIQAIDLDSAVGGAAGLLGQTTGADLGRYSQRLALSGGVYGKASLAGAVGGYRTSRNPPRESIEDALPFQGRKLEFDWARILLRIRASAAAELGAGSSVELRPDPKSSEHVLIDISIDGRVALTVGHTVPFLAMLLPQLALDPEAKVVLHYRAKLDHGDVQFDLSRPDDWDVVVSHGETDRLQGAATETTIKPSPDLSIDQVRQLVDRPTLDNFLSTLRNVDSLRIKRRFHLGLKLDRFVRSARRRQSGEAPRPMLGKGYREQGGEYAAYATFDVSMPGPVAAELLAQVAERAETAGYTDDLWSSLSADAGAAFRGETPVLASLLMQVVNESTATVFVHELSAHYGPALSGALGGRVGAGARGELHLGGGVAAFTARVIKPARNMTLPEFAALLAQQLRLVADDLEVIVEAFGAIRSAIETLADHVEQYLPSGFLPFLPLPRFPTTPTEEN